MAYAYIEDDAITQYPVTEYEIRTNFSNISFPRDLSTVDFSGLGVVYVTATEIPAFDSISQFVVEGDPTQNNGTWEKTWIVVDRPTDDVAVLVRKKRDAELLASDWTQLQNSPVDVSAWAAYRQDLRDIPDQAGFPTSVTWPTEPA